MWNREKLDPEDRIKLETWPEVVRLLRQYRELAFLPMYQPRVGLLFGVPKDFAERCDHKRKMIAHFENKLADKWKAALGEHWESEFDPDDDWWT
jgi:hypothetical protein